MMKSYTEEVEKLGAVLDEGDPKTEAEYDSYRCAYQIALLLEELRAYQFAAAASSKYENISGWVSALQENLSRSLREIIADKETELCEVVGNLKKNGCKARWTRFALREFGNYCLMLQEGEDREVFGIEASVE